LLQRSISAKRIWSFIFDQHSALESQLVF